jgi:DNA-binding response OmpR family regulator
LLSGHFSGLKIRGTIIAYTGKQFPLIMSRRILILDDDTDLLEILSLLLADNGYEILALKSGEKVFEAIQQFKPHLLLMDVILGNMDGRFICNKIKQMFTLNALRVILISGTHDLGASLHLKGAPNDYLAKPFDMGFLLNKIEHQLAS